MFFKRHRTVAAVTQSRGVKAQSMACEKCLIRRSAKIMGYIEMAHIIAFPFLGDALITEHKFVKKLSFAGHFENQD